MSELSEIENDDNYLVLFGVLVFWWHLFKPQKHQITKYNQG